ncbi:alkaline shock response membrane anchor protein AmaP [Corynebacterium yudongzhengii]|uniref:Alkaline shock response membrane anchor protein AmaP n=1 Tax=Corynebacterium yudongzhengii TaxID=2080740 RepID=A0A2U1TA22_9CORY|nr:alkaline shock response membrane anchor protein AmaP [Corynebacterium yudongzhengii]AWB81209.1 alkaline shock response membrane anchor protein AmaP [Corynebacterium yudongzhengii]PWC02748.1 alkaline shock response membrane anchor protein AmaP [Corynebacterium yudongzhengii]
MSRALAGFDRVIIGLLGVIALVLGLWAALFAFDVDIAHQIGSWYDEQVLQSFLESNIYPVVVIILAVVLILFGLWWLIANLRRNSFNRMTAGSGRSQGKVTVSTNRVAKATAEHLRELRDVTQVQTQTRLDRGRPTIGWTITAKPTVNLPRLLDDLDEANDDVRAALPGFDVDTRFLLNFTPVETD